MSWLSDIFGGQSKKTEDLVNNLKPMKVYGFGDSETAPNYRKIVEDRLAGRGVGYDPKALDQIAAPYAKAERDTFTNYSTPNINAAASAKGLGRSTIPVSQIRQGSQEVETSIGKNVAELTKANEDQKRTEINKALDQYYTYTKDDLGYKNMQSQADYANYLTSIGLSQEADKINSQMMQKIIQTVGGAAVGVAGVATGNPMMALSGLNMATSSGGGYSNSSMSDLIMMQNLLGGNASRVNTGYNYAANPNAGMTLRS